MKLSRHVFLGMPGYGQLSAEASRGFWRASNGNSFVTYSTMQSSLLAQCFNGLWCQALNTQADGKQVDYFAMQHSDVEPCDGWLDMLIDEMEAKDLDILGVAIPIKDNRGITSIAIGEPGDNWRVKCRLSLREIHSLPATFTSEDVGGQLLLNTGLWVCRFNPEWNKLVHFEINDRIVYDKQRKLYVAQVEPEDWFFSRLLHELGLKIGCTRLIPLNHRGQATFTNKVPYGERFDSHYLNESIIPKSSIEFEFPEDVPGWLTRCEGEKLAELAKGKRVLEIGSYCGRSTICLAQTAQSVASVDPHDGRGTVFKADTFEMFQSNLKRYGIKNVESHRTTELPNDQFDLVFIDASHDYENVANDIERSMALLTSEGLLAFHDYKNTDDPGVTKAVDELLAVGGQLISTTDSLAVVRPPAAVPLEV